MAEVYSIEKLDLVLEKSLPPNLIVTAVGTVNSGGWSNFSLSQVEYLTPPKDGVQEYAFIGDPPSGIATQALESNKQAFARIERVDQANYWGPGLPIKGVRVTTSSNKMEATL